MSKDPLFLKLLGIILFITFCSSTAGAASGDTTVAPWKYNTKGAFTMSFDDSMETHAKLAMPAIIERGLVGTWFINPGQSRHKKNHKTWQLDAPKSGQELANHTWEHIGAKDLREADFQIGECARYIWALRGHEASKLLAFASGGGTTWNISISEMEKLKEKYHCVNRTSELSARTDLGVDGDRLIGKSREAVNEGRWVAIHFHGIGGEWLSIDTKSFIHLLDHLERNKDKIWSAGWSAAYQYLKERKHAQIDMLEKSDIHMRLRLTTGLSMELYMESLTLITEVPHNWSIVKVIQNGQSKTYKARNGKLQYEAIPHKGEIILQAVPAGT